MESTARLLIRIGSQPEQEYTLTQEVTILGREAINDLVINDAEVSRRHSRIVLESEGFMIEDLGSTNGTFVNGQRVTSAMVLYHGDTVELGKSAKLVFLGSAPRSAQAPAPMQQQGGIAAPPPLPAEPSRQQQQQYDDYNQYDQNDQYAEPDQYQGQPPAQQQQQGQYAEQYDEYDDYDDEDEEGGCQRYLITCGCLVLLSIFLLFAGLFILDQVAPDALYCGPLQAFWDATLGALLESLGRPLTC